MKHRKKFVLFVLLLAAPGWTAYEVRNFLNERWEYQILAQAFELRATYEGGSSAYFKALSRLKIKKYEALYNLGNLNFREALRLRDLAPLMSAAEYYREALRLDSELLPAKKNLELTEVLIAEIKKEEADKARQQQDNLKGQESEDDQLKDRGPKLPGLEPYVPPRP